jgi:hypothetical protein
MTGKETPRIHRFRGDVSTEFGSQVATKRVRILIKAEYEFPDTAEIVDVAGGTAIRTDGCVVKPELEFLQLNAATGTSSGWPSISEKARDQVFAAERQSVVDVLLAQPPSIH